MPLNDPYFFGYGSLVNRATHDYASAHPAQLVGWRRAWMHTALRPVAFLTVTRDPGSVLDGLIAPVPNADWAALDAREWAYDRVAAAGEITHALPQTPEIAVYAVPNRHQAPQGERHPILLSYLDVVVQGYLREFGADGVGRFFATTTGWDAPVLNDRAAPRYPRHQILSAVETALLDQHLADLSVQFLPAD